MSRSLPQAARATVPTWALSWALALAACSAGTRGDQRLRDVDWLVRHGRFKEAVELAAERAEAAPEDPEALAVHRAASAAWYLELGRRATFGGLDDEALEQFEKARELMPDEEAPAAWIRKTHGKLADLWYQRASELHANDRLEDARLGYEQALVHVPNHAGAQAGIARLGIQQNYRAGLVDDYYTQGIADLAAWRYGIAKNQFVKSTYYDTKENPRTQRRIAETNRELARKRVVVARRLEQDGLFGAARNDFRTATLMDPENSDAAEGLARCETESKAAEILRDARMAVERGEFTSATALLEEGQALTQAQGEAFVAALGSIDLARAAAAYQRALTFEHDFRYEEAIAAYEALLEQHGYYMDARARASTLQDYAERAPALYERARVAATDIERAELLRQIEIFWPEYRDIREQLTRLRPLLDQ